MGHMFLALGFLLVSIEGQPTMWFGGNSTHIPSDANGAYGNSQFVQFVNPAIISTYYLTGKALSASYYICLAFSSTGPCGCKNPGGDGVVLFDEAEKSFIVTYKASIPSYICIAVSRNLYPVGYSDWNAYSVKLPNAVPEEPGIYMDYPKPAVWRLCTFEYFMLTYIWMTTSDSSPSQMRSAIHTVPLSDLYSGIFELSNPVYVERLTYWNFVLPIHMSQVDVCYEQYVFPTLLRFNGDYNSGDGGLDVIEYLSDNPPTIRTSTTAMSNTCAGRGVMYGAANSACQNSANVETQNCVLSWPAYGFVDTGYVVNADTALTSFKAPQPGSTPTECVHFSLLRPIGQNGVWRAATKPFGMELIYGPDANAFMPAVARHPVARTLAVVVTVTDPNGAPDCPATVVCALTDPTGFCGEENTNLMWDSSSSNGGPNGVRWGDYGSMQAWGNTGYVWTFHQLSVIKQVISLIGVVGGR